MDIKEFFYILRRRKWVVIQAFLVIVSTTITLTYLIPPTYETYAKLLIMTSPTSSSASLFSSTLKDFGSLVSSGSTAEISTSIAVASVRPVIEPVIKKYDLKGRDGKPMSPDTLLKPGILVYIFSLPYVSITQLLDANLFTITCGTKDPKLSQGIANSLAKEIVEFNIKLAREEYSSAKSFIERQIKKVTRDYYKYQSDLKRFKEREQTVDLDSEIKVAIEKVAELYKQKEDNVIDLEQAKAKLRVLKEQVGKMDSTRILPSVMTENPTVKTQRDKIGELEILLVKATQELTEDHPEVVSIRSQLKKAHENLANEIQVYQSSNNLLSDLEREFASLEVHLVGVNADIDKYSALFRALPEKVMSQARLQLQLSVAENIYRFLLQRKSEIGIAEATTISNIRVVDPAYELPIGKPTKPKKVVNFAVGIFLGLFSGIGFALLFEKLDVTIKSTEDMAKIKNVVSLGVVPLIKKGAPLVISKRKLIDPVCESYRTVRNSIRFSCLDNPLKRILITSAGPGEGKTLTAVNLSISIAREGKKVLLMDADLRRSMVHMYFNMDDKVGVTSVLLGEKDIKDAIFKTEQEGLFVMPAGTVPVDPAKLLESLKMHQLIVDLAEKFDVVILDTAPTLVLDDAIILSQHTDGVVVVVESGRTTVQAVTQMEEIFRLAKVVLLGYVLNKQKTLRGTSDYYRYYKYYAKSEKSTRERKV